MDLLRRNGNGLLVPPKDVVSLASAMKSLASQPDLRATMGANNTKHISHSLPEEWYMGITRANRSNGRCG